MSARLTQVAGHAWRVGTARPLLFALIDAAAIGPLRRFWEKEAPWQAGKLVERSGNRVRLDGCRLDVGSSIFSTFQRGCLWLSRHEEPERIAVGRYLDPALPVVELGASTGMLSCLINRRLRHPDHHVAVEANPDLIPVIHANRQLNNASFTVVHAAVAYDQRFNFDRATLVCDIEGMEIDLWRREREVIVNHVVWLIVELHEPISGTEAVTGFIRELRADGFDLVWERSWTRVFRNTRWKDQ
jgi:hypothetical protein